MWKDLDPIWQEAISLAWESYEADTIPIGAVIVDSDGQIVSRGRNRIYENKNTSPLAGTDMAHAEMDAMLQLMKADPELIRRCTLYTTMEPCPMCFGTLVMSGMRKLHYACRDGIAGSAAMNEAIPYIQNKRISVVFDIDPELENFLIALQAVHTLNTHPRADYILSVWNHTCPDGVAMGRRFFMDGYFEKAINSGYGIDRIYDERSL